MKKLIALLALLTLGSVARAQVEFDGSTSATCTVNQVTISWNQTVSSNDNRLMFIVLGSGSGGDGPLNGTNTPTVNGDPSTLLGFFVRDNSGGGTAWRLGVWYYLAPSTGTATISYSQSPGVQYICGGSMVFSGVDQSSPFGDSDYQEGTGAASMSIDSVIGGMVADFIIQNAQAARDMTEGSEQTRRIDAFSAESSVAPWVKASSADGDTSVSLSWSTSGGAVNWSHFAVALNPAEDEGGGSDGTPDAFSFSDETDVELSTTITSAPVEIKGIDEAIECAATGGTIDVNGDNDFQATREVDNNDQIRARHTSSNSYSTAVNTVVDCNGVSDTFTSTTKAEPQPEPGVSHLSIYLYLRQMRK